MVLGERNATKSQSKGESGCKGQRKGKSCPPTEVEAKATCSSSAGNPEETSSKRPRRHSGEGSLGDMERRRNSEGSHGAAWRSPRRGKPGGGEREVLSPGLQSGRERAWSGVVRQHDHGEVEADGNHQRGRTSPEWGHGVVRDEDPLVQSGLQPRSHRRRSRSCHRYKDHAGSQQGGWLDEQFSPSGRGLRSGRRASGPERKDGRCSSGERQRRRRKEERGEEQIRRKEEVQERVQERKEGKEEREEEKEEEVQHFIGGVRGRGRQPAKEGQQETSQGGLRWDRSGRERTGSVKGGQEGQEASPKKGFQRNLELWQQVGRDHEQRWSRRGGGRSFVQPGVQSQGCGRSLPWSPGSSRVGPDAGHDAYEPGRGGPPRAASWHPSSVLQAGSAEEMLTPSSTRTSHPHEHLGQDVERSCGTGMRHSHAAGEVAGTHSQRWALECVPKNGVAGTGEHRGCHDWGDQRCAEGHSSRQPSEIPGVPAGWKREKQWRWRPRKRWIKRRQESVRRSRQERRKRQTEQRRWEEKGRCERSGQAVLKGQDEAEEAMRTDAGFSPCGGEGASSTRITGTSDLEISAGASSEVFHTMSPDCDGGAATLTGGTLVGSQQFQRLSSNSVTPTLDFNGAGVAEQSMHAIGSLPNLSSEAPSSAVERPTGLPTEICQEPKIDFDSVRDREKVVSAEGLCEHSLSSCGTLLLQKILEVLPLRSKTTGKKEKTALFPLPTSRERLRNEFPNLSSDEVSWMISVCVCLNSFWGCDIFFDGAWSNSVRACMSRLVADVQRFCSLPALVPTTDWSQLFSVRGVDYRGDEVRVAKYVKWENIQPALPKEIGVVKLEDVCTLGCKHYVQCFDQYIKPMEEWGPITRPRVMVGDEDWAEVCRGLVASGICTFIEESDVFMTAEGPLLNGMFGVTKDDFTDSGVEIFRLIMHLIPLNGLCHPMSGDVDTLPSWGSMSPFFLQPTECLLVSSEDVKCFFYTISVPECWIKYLAFNKLVPDECLEEHLKGKTVYLASRVLPMGFLNSVSLAQHVHRNLVSWSGSGEMSGVNPPEQELRKDRPHSAGSTTWRVYLDNYDLLEKVQATEMVGLEGTCPPGVLALRQEYEVWSVPRNVKKAVERSPLCEVQGATVDGVAGCAFPRESKLGKYFGLAMSLCNQTHAQQKQWQVVCGGLVYVSMFRRPLLGSLNRVWTHIESYSHTSSGVLATPSDCRLEVLRFLGMLPLGRMDFRLAMDSMATCSDASTQGGGACASTGLTPVGEMVAQGSLRGEFPECKGEFSVLCVGLFDGISALRVALDLIGVQVIGHVSVDKHQPARRVVESHYPGTLFYEDVNEITEKEVLTWTTRFSQCSLVLLGGGPPCQGVSGLNYDRKGALRDERSCLFTHVSRIKRLLQSGFRWCPVHHLMESVASMDAHDRDIMSEDIGDEPIICDAGGLTWCRRPRLYWLSWELPDRPDHEWSQTEDGLWELHLQGQQDLSPLLQPGWKKVDQSRSFPTFTTSRPSTRPGRKPAGIQQCDDAAIRRWEMDSHRFPPYQYKGDNCVMNAQGDYRVPDVSERELILGFPLNYTAGCLPKGQRKTGEYQDTRLTLLGNSWSVPVVACLLEPLFSLMGLISPLSVQEVVDNCVAGTHVTVQGRLVRLPLQRARAAQGGFESQLTHKLGNLISIKGEDIMLTTPTSQMCKFHRLRASVPGRLWKWRVIAGWRWTLGKEHINALELRAIFTTLKWRIEHQLQHNCRMIHLTDSLVCLHALCRGRSSSRKLRRTMSRINSLILAANIQPVWGYIHTDQNPADKPSRWGQRGVKTKFRDAKKTRA